MYHSLLQNRHPYVIYHHVHHSIEILIHPSTQLILSTVDRVIFYKTPELQIHRFTDHLSKNESQTRHKQQIHLIKDRLHQFIGQTCHNQLNQRLTDHLLHNINLLRQRHINLFMKISWTRKIFGVLGNRSPVSLSNKHIQVSVKMVSLMQQV